MSAHGPEEGKLARLLADAEQEMRRKLPDGNDGAPGAKRRKGGGGGGAADAAEAAAAAGGRFDYGAIKELATGITGFILTCPLQRWVQSRSRCGGLTCRRLLWLAPPGLFVTLLIHCTAAAWPHATCCNAGRIRRAKRQVTCYSAT
jgi:hypothetical protein